MGVRLGNLNGITCNGAYCGVKTGGPPSHPRDTLENVTGNDEDGLIVGEENRVPSKKRVLRWLPAAGNTLEGSHCMRVKDIGSLETCVHDASNSEHESGDRAAISGIAGGISRKTVHLELLPQIVLQPVGTKRLRCTLNGLSENVEIALRTAHQAGTFKQIETDRFSLYPLARDRSKKRQLNRLTNIGRPMVRLPGTAPGLAERQLRSIPTPVTAVKHISQCPSRLLGRWTSGISVTGQGPRRVDRSHTNRMTRTSINSIGRARRSLERFRLGDLTQSTSLLKTCTDITTGRR